MDGEHQDERSGLARWLFPDGQEPDPRFTLANERTFLAWTRTSLAFYAAGLALHAFDIPSLHSDLQTAGALVLVVMGVIIGVGAMFRWVRVERAMRHDKPLPVPGVAPVLGIALLAGGIVLLVGLA